MASLGNACRLTARVTGSQLRSNVSVRGFRTATANLAAQNFAMPAMSPTMTEGNISAWKVKEGDSFSAGDILLEIETDKAQMEVEAQEDGIMAKIMQGDGSKGVAVGTRIAVLAESGDDISSLEIPAEDKPKGSSPKQEAAPQESSPSPPKESASKPSNVGNMPASAGETKKQTYPLYPSVQHLLHINGLSAEEANKIPATGPSGRLLKGDVLAYLGRIEKSYSAEQSSRISKLGHLDLSNIKIATPPASAQESKASSPEAAPAPPAPIELSLPISFNALLEVQARIEKTLGTHLPTSTFVARAIELANDSLPLSKTHKPTADDLFNSVLGLDALNPRTSTGSFTPQITPLALTAAAPSRPAISQKKKVDIFDEILGAKPKKTTLRPIVAKERSGAVNVFSVTADKGDEKRAMVFLERVKSVLEAEPGRLVI